MQIRKGMILIGAAVVGTAARSAMGGPVDLTTLPNPTLAQLEALGTAGVIVGPDQFYNFNDLAGTGAPSASQIQVSALYNSNFGLQFLSNWFAPSGGTVSDLITFDVKPVSTATHISTVSLLSNGTAPVPETGTFSTTTLSTQLADDTAGPVLSTYNDGVTAPVDTTRADTNSATATVNDVAQLHVTDSIYLTASPAAGGDAGGLATLSLLDNTFGVIPEPATIAVLLPGTLLMLKRSRRR